METFMEILIQTLGILGIIASILSFQNNDHKKIMFLRTTNEALFAVQYILLGAYTGAAMNIAGCVRNLLFAHKVARNESTVASRIVFCIIFTTSGILTWNGFSSILVIFAKVLSTMAYGSSRTGRIRLLILTTSTCWLVYNFFVSSYTGAVCEILTLCSVVSGIIRFDIYPAITRKLRD